jgi:hypothetical protein
LAPTLIPCITEVMCTHSTTASVIFPEVISIEAFIDDLTSWFAILEAYLSASQEF